MNKYSKNAPLFLCLVCFKRYYKKGLHAKCYKCYCILCCISFQTPDALETHAKKWHPIKWCDECKEVFKCIDAHKENQHR